jgi:HD-GYP domain-containing protein (c-di-GMP phosphodiesterase class II)
MGMSLDEREKGVNKSMSAKKRIPLDDLKPETYYDAPLWLDEEFLLLSNDAPVTENLVANLKTWGYKGVWTDGSLVSGNSAAKASAETVSGAVLNNDAKEAEGRRRARKFFEDLANSTRKVYDTFNRDGHLDMTSITDEVKKVIQMIKDYRSYMLRLPDLKADGIDYLFTHSARTTIISISIGDALKLPNFRLIELGIAAMLHEVGMMKIPRQVYDKSTPLSEKEKKLISTHPVQGLKMLQEYSKENANPLAQDILMGVWQHHERSNGSGYPQGLSGESITIFGKIIAAACSYDAQISNRPFRDGVDGFTTMLLMLKEMRSLYDEKVISALLNSISIYPLGNYVRLKSGAIGIVVDIGDDPRYPVVKLHLDENLHMYKEQPIIKTRDDDEGLSVTGVLIEQEVQDLVSKDLLPR